MEFSSNVCCDIFTICSSGSYTAISTSPALTSSSAGNSEGPMHGLAFAGVGPMGKKLDLQRIRIAHTSNPVGKSGSRSRWLHYFWRSRISRYPSQSTARPVHQSQSRCTATMSAAIPSRWAGVNNWSIRDVQCCHRASWWGGSTSFWIAELVTFNRSEI